MTILLIGLILFLGAHSVSIFAEPWRNGMAARLGDKAWQGLFSLVSLAGFALLVWGYGLARQEPVVVYVPPSWLRHLAMLLLLPVFPILLAAYLPGRIRDRLGHPMLLATKLWALAHLLANGMLADLLLFGGFLLWAGVDRASLKRRQPRPLQMAPAGRFNDHIAVVAGIVLYVLFALWAHGALIGIPLI